MLFLFNLRRASERAGRAAEQLDADAIQRQMLDTAALMIVILWLTGCAMVGSESRPPCPPVVEYTAADHARAADEVEALPEGAVIIRMLSDYTVLRDKARACL